MSEPTEIPDLLTSTEAATLCRYSRSDAFLIAFRRCGYEVVGPPRRPLVRRSDVEKFLQLNSTESY